MIDDPLPAISPGTARYLARQAAEQAARDAEALRIKARDDAVWGAIHRSAWRLAVALALLTSPALAHTPDGASCMETEVPAGRWVVVPSGKVSFYFYCRPGDVRGVCWRPVCLLPPAAGG